MIVGWMVLVAVAAAGDGPFRFRRDAPTPELVYDAKAEALRLEAIDRLQRLLDEPVAPETRAEMRFRLASLTFEQGRVLRLREMETTGAPSPRGSIAWQERAIALHRSILAEFPRSLRASEAAVALGRALEELGRPDDADEAWKWLVRTHPGSPLLAEAWLQLGEHAFDRGEAHRALSAYLQAAAWPDDPLAPYVLYKLGWAQYNVGDLDAGVDSLRRVVALGLAVPADDATTLRMHEEALTDLVRFYADLGDPVSADAYFASLGRADLARKCRAVFAGALREQGRTDDAVTAYRRLLLDDPASPDAVAWRQAIVEILAAADRREAVLVELDRLATMAGADDALAKLLQRQALAWHDAARRHDRSRSAEADPLYALADEAYRRWLGRFADRPEAPEVRYAHAELLYRLGRYRAAHDAYVAVVEADPIGPRAAFCAESAVHAAEQLVGPIERPGRPTAASEPIALTDDERLLLAAYGRLADGPRGVDARYRAAYLLYHRYRFEEAATLFREVIALDPRSKEAELGAHLILDALAVRESWDALAETAGAFAAAPGLGTAAFRAEVRSVHVNASFRRVEAAYARDRDAAAAGAGFEAFATTFPDEALAAQALHDAAVRYAEAGRWADALRARTVLVDDPRFGPRSRWHAEDLRELGFGLEQIADFAGAAERYEALWGLADRGEVSAARDAIWSAAVFRHALGDREQALADYRAFAAAGDDPRVDDARLREGKLLLELGRADEAVDVLLLLGSDEATVLAGRALAAAGRTAERDRLYLGAVARGGDPRWVAEMRAALAERTLAAYHALRIEGRDDAALTRTLGRKTAALRAVEEELLAVIETGAGEPGLVALVALADAYRSFAGALLAAPVPRDLPSDAVDDYERGVGDRAYVLEERAARAYALALSRAAELGLYGDAAVQAFRALAELRPDEAGGLPEVLPRRAYTAAARAKATGFAPTLD